MKAKKSNASPRIFLSPLLLYAWDFCLYLYGFSILYLKTDPCRDPWAALFLRVEGEQKEHDFTAVAFYSSCITEAKIKEKKTIFGKR